MMNDIRALLGSGRLSPYLQGTFTEPYLQDWLDM
jgi:hypothetical protein